MTRAGPSSRPVHRNTGRSGTVSGANDGDVGSWAGLKVMTDSATGKAVLFDIDGTLTSELASMASAGTT